MSRISRFIATAAVSFVLYLLLVGSMAPGEILLGAGVAVLSALLVGAFLPFGMGFFHPVRIARTIAYLPYFLWKMVQANLILAWTVIRPSLPIAPSIVRATTSMKSAHGKLLLSSSITLTPGTLSVDVEGDDLYVHVVTAGPQERERPKDSILAPFERRLEGVTE
jgi:multicomponent Na+:H+ antiporter subunit E